MSCSRVIRFLSAALLGVGAAVLVSCGGSGKGLIPAQNAGPLQSDFDAVAQAAQAGDGNCAATATAIRKTEQDFRALPATVDPGLHSRLSDGIDNLRARALALCAQALPSATVTNGATTPTTDTTQTDTTGTSTQTVPTDTTTVPTISTPTTTVPATPGGGTPAPGGTPGADTATTPATPGGGGAGGGDGGGGGGAGAGAGNGGAGGQ
jgi:hypothetical protein